MQKNLLVIFICMLLIATALPALGITKNIKFQQYNASMLDEIDQQSTKSDKVYVIGASDRELAQSFQPTSPILTKVILRLKSTGIPEFYYYYVDIKSSPLSSALTTANIHRDEILTGTGYYEFDFPDISVTIGGTYYIIIRGVSDSPDSSKVYWWYGYPDPYDRGNAWYESVAGWNYLQEGPDRCDYVFQTYGASENQPPNKPATPSGQTNGKRGLSYSYSTYAIDPNDEQVYYWFDWGDDTSSGWLGPHNSGDVCSVSHVWSFSGTYQVKVKAKDTNDVESVWSDPLSVTMPRCRTRNILFIKLFENFQEISPIIEKLLGLLGI